MAKSNKRRNRRSSKAKSWVSTANRSDGSPLAGGRSAVGSGKRAGRPKSGPPLSGPPPRNRFLDSLRGLAIVLMLIDHAASYWFDQKIGLGGVRFFTRLSMPLFCVLLGYFLPPDRRFRWTRYAQILAAGVAVNLLYWPRNGELEILVSLLTAALVGTALGRAAPLMLITMLFYQSDPSARWFDYQLTLVLALVAQGVVLRRFGPIVASVTGGVLLAMTVSGLWIWDTDTHRFLVWFLLPATGLVAWGTRFPERRIPGTEWLGRYPLTVYVVHFYVIALTAMLVRGTWVQP